MNPASSGKVVSVSKSTDATVSHGCICNGRCHDSRARMVRLGCVRLHFFHPVKVRSESWWFGILDECHCLYKSSDLNKSLPSPWDEGDIFHCLHWNTEATWYSLFAFQGFLKIPIWWLKPSSPKKHGENAQDQVNGMTCKMDALQVSPAGGERDRVLKGVIALRALSQNQHFNPKP